MDIVIRCLKCDHTKKIVLQNVPSPTVTTPQGEVPVMPEIPVICPDCFGFYNSGAMRAHRLWKQSPQSSQAPNSVKAASSNPNPSPSTSKW